MKAKETKRKASVKKTAGSGNVRKRKSVSVKKTAGRTAAKGKGKSASAEDYNTPFMRKIIIITVLLALLAAGLAVWSFMKIKGLTVFDLLPFLS